MSIASAIATKQQQVADSYTAVSNKGGTLPATQNLTNLATAISSIPSGGGGGYSELPSYQVENGVASRRSITLTNDNFSNITNVNVYGFYCCYSNATSLTGTVSMPNLISISHNGLREAFSYTNITSADLSKLVNIGEYGLYRAFEHSKITSLNLQSLQNINETYGLGGVCYYCEELTDVNLSNLSEISGSYGMNGAFNRCSNLVSVRFPKLSSLAASRAMGGNLTSHGAFGYCTNLQDVYFNSLTTSSFGTTYNNQFQNLLYNTGNSVIHTIHFPSNLESTISGLTGYPLFGGTSGYVVCAFDLPSTQ